MTAWDITYIRLNSQKATPLLTLTLRWRHNDHDGGSNHQPHGCLLNRLFRRKSKKTSKLHVTGLCVGNSPRPVNSPHKGPVTRKMFPFDDVIIMGNLWGVYREKFGENWPSYTLYTLVLQCLVNSSLPSTTYKHPLTVSLLVQIMARCLFTTKPLSWLSKPMLTFHQSLPRLQWKKFIKTNQFLLTKLHLKLSAIFPPFCPKEMS